jgi:membrane-bound serine protease (ClpP class)
MLPFADDSEPQTLQRLENAAESLIITATTFCLLVYVVWKTFPHTPLYGRFVQIHEQQPGKGYVVQTAEQHDAAIGLKGVAVSLLRPAGRGRFGDATYSVVSRAEFIEEGNPIIIVQVDGNRYVVDKIEEKS